KKIPFVIVKAAASLDGKIATKTGESKWITGPQARKLAHKVREKVDAILVGVNTVIRDDPSLLPPLKKRFFRIILDSTLQISPEARVLKEQTKAQTIIFTTPRAPKQKVDHLQNEGVTVATVRKNSEQRVSLEEVLKELGRLKILSLLVEGGGEVIGSFFEKGYVDKVFLFLAPRIVGGRNSVTWVESKGVKILSQTPRIEVRSFKRIGEDLLVEGYLK
ncbi:dihydrofolate reductase family protein, partial [Candidatus Aerophobetes bacterium]|nr:dihydrofolate reductase family protein [Candidatus Aerophobetes bacterium]